MLRSSSGRPGWRTERGASAVEFALILPFLLILVFGIIEFGLGFYRSQNFQAAAREGARLLAVGVDNEIVGDRVRATVGGSVVPSHVDIDFEPCDADDIGRITVSVLDAHRDRYGISIPFTSISSEPSYASTAVFRCELPQVGG